MAVHFIDDQTGEISDVVIDVEDTPTSERRQYREEYGDYDIPEQRERKRTSLWPVALVFACIASFLIGGGMGVAMTQGEIHELKMQLDYPAVP